MCKDTDEPALLFLIHTSSFPSSVSFVSPPPAETIVLYAFGMCNRWCDAFREPVLCQILRYLEFWFATENSHFGGGTTK